MASPYTSYVSGYYRADYQEEAGIFAENYS